MLLLRKQRPITVQQHLLCLISPNPYKFPPRLRRLAKYQFIRPEGSIQQQEQDDLLLPESRQGGWGTTRLASASRLLSFSKFGKTEHPLLAGQPLHTRNNLGLHTPLRHLLPTLHVLGVRLRGCLATVQQPWQKTEIHERERWSQIGRLPTSRDIALRLILINYRNCDYHSHINQSVS